MFLIESKPTAEEGNYFPTCKIRYDTPSEEPSFLARSRF